MLIIVQLAVPVGVELAVELVAGQLAAGPPVLVAPEEQERQDAGPVLQAP